MSFTDDILIILSSYSGGYRRLRELAYGGTRPEYRDKLKDNTLRVTLSRLKNRGLVAKKGSGWHITKEGKEFLKNKTPLLRHFPHRKSNKNKEKNLIIAFDIPEIYHNKRNWLRFELVGLGFHPVQKSVWFGPGPLPEDFLTSLEELKILNFIKFFKVKESDIV